jgi:hypothetical protein
MTVEALCQTESRKRIRIRTPKTLASDKAWYAVNHGAAKAAVYMSIGMATFGIVVALLSIVTALLSSTMSDYMEDTVLFAAGAAPLVLVLGLMVAMNIELKKLDKDSLADPLEARIRSISSGDAWSNLALAVSGVGGFKEELREIR